MRFYSIGNMYLSSIQQGIQAFHCLGEMTIKYDAPELAVDSKFYDWLDNHKTLICLNGGNNERLNDFYTFLNSSTYNPYPYTKFHEDDASMGGMLTCVGIVVPEQIYNINIDDSTTYQHLTSWQIELYNKIKRMPTAR